MTIEQKQNYTRSLMEATTDPLIAITSTGEITEVNEAVLIVTGETRETIIGSNFVDYFTDKKKAKAGYQFAIDQNKISEYALAIKHKDGERTDVLCNLSAYKSVAGKVLDVFVAVRVVSDQKWAMDLRIANKELLFHTQEKEKRANELIIANKELLFQNEEKEKRANELIIANEELLFQNEEREKRANELVLSNKALLFQTEQNEKQESANKELEAFRDSLELSAQYSRSLIEASRDPLVTINAEGIITDVNEASIRVTGVLRNSIIGTNFSTYFTDPEKAQGGYEEAFKRGFVKDYALTIKHKHGRLTDVLYNASVYKDKEGKVLGVFASARDVTDQTRIQLELTNLKEMAELTTIVAEEAKRKAEKATKIAEEAVKSKQQFLSNMSHEIRTPMNSIIGFTKVVLKTELNAKQKEYLKAIEVSGDAMVLLINDILDLAKVDAGKLVFEETPFKLENSMATMLHLFEPKIQEKNLSFVHEYDPKIPDVLIGDSVRLHQIIINLVSNALKFTNRGEIKVRVAIESEDEDKIRIQFSVKDTGIGIAQEKIEKIFENFQQASSSTTRLYGGTGLGLAIVKQLVESQGGVVSVVSEIGQGSTFGFSLSFLKTCEEAESNNETFELDSNLKNINVLVVEDMPLNQLLMKTLLDEFEFNCDIAENGKRAIEKMENNLYDIILMDLQMPEMNGFEATEYIRNTLKSTVPIIALTADVTTADLEKCKDVGMNDYLAKPMDDKLLYAKMIALVKNPEINKLIPNRPKNKTKKIPVTRLDYLNNLTKSNSKLICEMIALYLERTPTLVQTMTLSFKNKDWPTLHSSVHKMIPSFSIMGMKPEYEAYAKEIQVYNGSDAETSLVSGYINRIAVACEQACVELTADHNRLKNS